MRNSSLAVFILFIWATGAAFGASAEWVLNRNLDIKMFGALSTVLLFGMALWGWRDREVEKKKSPLLPALGAICVIYFIAMAGILSATMVKRVFPIDSNAVFVGAIALMIIFAVLGTSWKRRDERDKQKAEESAHGSI